MESAAHTWNKVMLALACALLLRCVTVVCDKHQSSSPAEEVQLQDVVVVVLTQPQAYHKERAHLFREHFEEQIQAIPQDERPLLFLSHENWPELRGAWTVFPLIPEFAKLFSEKKWIIVCEEETRIDMRGMVSLLQEYDDTVQPFLGRGLQDSSATIIHHFAFFDDSSAFSYPDFGAGMALSVPFVKRFADQLAEKNIDTGFSIDPKHEFAKYILDNLGVSLSPLCEFCGGSEDTKAECDCVTLQPVKFPDCGPPIGENELFVAVKTCSKFHEDRVPVVKATWGKDMDLIEYYSDQENASIPTINLGVPNTERGHCGKTQAILKRAMDMDHISSREWLLIADDDTIINLELLRHVLSCYKSEEPIFLGERYGYGSSSGRGYDYITGGGGMLFNHAAVQLLAKEFRCPSDDSPDDMLLGMFFAARGIPIIHSPYFHQARPEDYSEDFLKNQVPVSFHKHWNNNPYEVYTSLKKGKPPHSSVDVHEEL